MRFGEINARGFKMKDFAVPRPLIWTGDKNGSPLEEVVVILCNEVLCAELHQRSSHAIYVRGATR